jgi:[ribosomal protein S18]-alanine N-acetyltransferase
MNVIAIPACAENISEIMALEVQGFQAGILEAEDVFLERIRVFPDGFLLLKDQDTDGLIGYISSEIWQRDASFNVQKFNLNHRITDTHCVDGTELYISSMTIDPKYRGFGMGKILFQACVERQTHIYPQIKSLILLVNETWHQAREIYTDYGLEEIARLSAFFTPAQGYAQDGIVMRKDI